MVSSGSWAVVSRKSTTGPGAVMCPAWVRSARSAIVRIGLWALCPAVSRPVTTGDGSSTRPTRAWSASTAIRCTQKSGSSAAATSGGTTSVGAASICARAAKAKTASWRVLLEGVCAASRRAASVSAEGGWNVACAWSRHRTHRVSQPIRLTQSQASHRTSRVLAARTRSRTSVSAATKFQAVTCFGNSNQSAYRI